MFFECETRSFYNINISCCKIYFGNFRKLMRLFELLIEDAMENGRKKMKLNFPCTMDGSHWNGLPLVRWNRTGR